MQVISNDIEEYEKYDINNTLLYVDPREFLATHDDSLEINVNLVKVLSDLNGYEIP